MWDRAHQSLELVMANTKCFEDCQQSDAPEYCPGNHVWLSTCDLHHLPSFRKLNTHYVRSFKIIKQVNPVTYKLNLPHHTPMFHIFQFKSVVAELLDEMSPLTMPPSPLQINGQPAYVTGPKQVMCKKIGRKRSVKCIIILYDALM